MLLSRHLLHINVCVNTLTRDALRHILVALSLSTWVGVSLPCLSRAAVLGPSECTLNRPNFSPQWLYQLLLPPCRSRAYSCLIFKFFFADLMNVKRFLLMVCIFLIMRLNIFSCGYWPFVSPLVELFVHILGFFFVCHVVLFLVGGSSSLYILVATFTSHTLCRDLQVSCLSFALSMRYFSIQTSLI